MPPATPAKCSFGTRAERSPIKFEHYRLTTPEHPQTPALASLFVSRFKHVPAGLVGRASGHPGGCARSARSRSGANSGARRFRPFGDGALRQFAGHACSSLPTADRSVGDGDTCRAAPAPRSRPPKSPSESAVTAPVAVTTRGAPAHRCNCSRYRWRLITRRWCAHFNLQHLGVLAAGRVVLRATLGTAARARLQLVVFHLHRQR